jgi:hypothetical protein
MLAGITDSGNGGKTHVIVAWTEHEKSGTGQGGGVSVGGGNCNLLVSKLITD